VIDALGGLPGVHSHRWVKAKGFDGKFSEPAEPRESKKFPGVLPRGQNGYEATDQEFAEAVLKKMEGIAQEKRTARLGGVMIFWDGEHGIKKENWTEGYIADRIMGDIQPGFPYRAILMIPQFGKPYGMLTDEEHEQVNFRRKNIQSLKPEILKFL